jgi:hypothetical protein
MKKKLLLLAVLGCLLNNQGNAQSPGTESPALNPNPEAITIAPKKGAFFITPFYQYSRFKNLELAANTSSYTLPEGNSYEEFDQDAINGYNNQFGTAYNYSMTGLKIGYQLIDGLGLSGYAGIKHFYFESWISDENKQSIITDYPALTTGLAVDYTKKITSSLSAIAFLSYNYTKTRSVIVDNKHSEDVVSSSLISTFWEANLAMAYRIGRFVPYAGAGFTQQFVNSITKEQLPILDSEGHAFTEIIEFDSHFKGKSIYGFAGLEYIFSKSFTVYARGSFINPARLSFGIRIII